jgi:5-methylcytosine-specific restriction endonuclease McrA
MGRSFDFPHYVQREARLRQWGICAHCGERLDDTWEHAHHVIPNQCGQAENPSHAFLRSSDNCAILCEACHEAAHAHGSFRLGAVASGKWFRYSHGKQADARHTIWCTRIDAEWRRLGVR